MKYSICGFSQERAIEFVDTVIENGKSKEVKLDCTDLIFLDWLVRFYPNMDKTQRNGESYFKLKYNKIIADLPILNIGQRALADRLNKLVHFGILSKIVVREETAISLYKFGENYSVLVDTDKRRKSRKTIGSESSPLEVNCTSHTQSTSDIYNIQDNKRKNNTSIIPKKDSAFFDENNNESGEVTPTDTPTYQQENSLNTQSSECKADKKVFCKPTIAEVQAYCKERGNSVDAERFIDYYTSVGWKIGRNPMKDWKAAVRTWERQSVLQSGQQKPMVDGEYTRNSDGSINIGGGYKLV